MAMVSKKGAKIKGTGSLCAVTGCPNNYRDNQGLSFFRFPAKDQDRCNRWIICCRRKDLEGKSPHELKTRKLCGVHFEDNMFMNTRLRNSLIWNAVPTIFATPNPVPLEEVTRPPRKNRKAESVTRKKRNYKKSKVQVNNAKTLPVKVASKFRGTTVDRWVHIKYKQKQLLAARSTSQAPLSQAYRTTILSPHDSLKAVPRILLTRVHPEEQATSVATVKKATKTVVRIRPTDESMEVDVTEDTNRLRSSRDKFGMTQCSICQVMFRSAALCWKQNVHVHNPMMSSREEQEDEDDQAGGDTRLVGKHYRCNLCGYRCYSRTFVVLHIKYTHLSDRPYSCPFCEHAGVERAKVRLHVRAAHPNKPHRVSTDERMLATLRVELKKHYTQIFDHSGKTMPEKVFRRSAYARSLYFLNARSTHQTSAPYLASPTILSPPESSQAVRRRLALNVHSREFTTSVGAATTTVKKEVDVKQEQVDEPSHADLSFTIKSEPVDGGYEQVCGIATVAGVCDIVAGVGDNKLGGGSYASQEQWADSSVAHIQPTDESLEVDLDVSGITVRQEAGSGGRCDVSSCVAESTAMTGRPWCDDWTVECVRLDDSEANGVHCSSVDISDRKLTMRPVVILEDIIEKILWGSYIAPPSGSVSNTAPHIGTDE